MSVRKQSSAYYEMLGAIKETAAAAVACRRGPSEATLMALVDATKRERQAIAIYLLNTSAAVMSTPELAKLGREERTVFEYLVHTSLGLKEVGRKLGKSWKTVETQRSFIFKKLGVHSRKELVRRYYPGHFEGEQP